jgi:hypothetical protein
MSYPEFSDFPPIPQRSAAEADFDTKMSALFQHFATTHRAELIALIDFLKTNSTIIGGALNATTVGLDIPAAAAFTSLLADSLGGAAVQADQLDAAPGKLMKNGAFGLGGVGRSIVDCNGITVSGFYVFDSATVNCPPFTQNGTIVHIARTNDIHTQIAVSRATSSGGRCAVRVNSDGSSWSPWREIYQQESILGPVSQSGGVPTGAIIDVGSNANGEYMMFAGGWQICTCQAFTTSAAGSLTWTFPASFYYPASPGRPAVSGAISTLTGQDAFLGIGGIAGPGGLATEVDVRAVKHDGTLIEAAASLIAIGRYE